MWANLLRRRQAICLLKLQFVAFWRCNRLLLKSINPSSEIGGFWPEMIILQDIQAFTAQLLGARVSAE